MRWLTVTKNYFCDILDDAMKIIVTKTSDGVIISFSTFLQSWSMISSFGNRKRESCIREYIDPNYPNL